LRVVSQETVSIFTNDGNLLSTQMNVASVDELAACVAGYVADTLPVVVDPSIGTATLG
jgi:hypothetical protein